MMQSAIERLDFSNFTEEEMQGSDNDVLMREAEDAYDAREFQRMLVFQQAHEMGLTNEEAEMVSGVTHAEYVEWHKAGGNFHNQAIPVSPTELNTEVNIVGSGVINKNSIELKKSFDFIATEKEKKPIGFLMKAQPKKYEGGKRTQQVTVQGKTGTFTRTQVVGSDKQQQQKKKITKEGGNKPDFTPEEKMKHTMMQKFAGIFKKIGKSITEKLKVLKDPENVKALAQGTKEHIEATVVRNDGVGALANDANAVSAAAQKKMNENKPKNPTNNNGGGNGGGDNEGGAGNKPKSNKKKSPITAKKKEADKKKPDNKSPKEKKKFDVKKKDGK